MVQFYILIEFPFFSPAPASSICNFVKLDMIQGEQIKVFYASFFKLLVIRNYYIGIFNPNNY